MLAQTDALTPDRLDLWMVETDDADELLPTSGPYLRFKTAFERVMAAILLVVLAPLIGLLMALVRLTSRGPAVYAQVRVGMRGREFRIYKLRSMVHDCERHTGPTWATLGDPRVTPLGRLLRKTHLDELPQLWNVIKGDMSLVGPRPERPEFVRQLEKLIPGYRRRLVVRPGVTGLAQIQLPPDTDVTSVQRKVERDLHYIERMGWLLDLKILVATAAKVIGVPCPTACRWLGIPTGIPQAASGAKANAANRSLLADPA
jgi:lipopolysaccharide/colanic/teichoic acid biosynthesis glycosyltransferase